jgi:hypothetical protein
MRWNIKITSDQRKFSFEIEVIYNVINKGSFHWVLWSTAALQVPPHAYFKADLWRTPGKKDKLVCYGTDDEGYDYVALEMEGFNSLLSTGSGSGQVAQSGARDCPAGPITWTILKRT